MEAKRTASTSKGAPDYSPENGVGQKVSHGHAHIIFTAVAGVDCSVSNRTSSRACGCSFIVSKGAFVALYCIKF